MEHRIEERPDRTVVELIGDIDGGIAQALAAIRTAAKSRTIVFDCSRITRINSVGIAQWMAAMKQYAGTSYRYAFCNEQFIDAAVMIPQFPCDGWIESVTIDYHCEPCTNVERVVYPCDGDTEALVARVEESRRCPKCSGAADPMSDIGVSFETLGERSCFRPRR